MYGVHVVGIDKETTRPGSEKLSSDVDGDLFPWESSVDSLDEGNLRSESKAEFWFFERRANRQRTYHGVNVATTSRGYPNTDSRTYSPSEGDRKI